MESFSRTLDNYTGSYVARRRRKRIIVVAAVLAAAAALAFGFAGLSRKGLLSAGGEGKPVPKKTVLASWGSKDWDEVLAACAASLGAAPLDPFYLGMGGLAAYYKGIELPEGEERSALMDEAVVSIRKALVAHGRSARGTPRAELEYVLGKAYYYKGRDFMDGAVKWLEASIDDGYLGADSREYLAVAYASLGNIEASLKNFEAALQRGRADLLLVAAARAYAEAGKDDRAESLLLEALSSSQDALAREKCRFGLADIYAGRGEEGKVEEQLGLALKENAESAEAHYRLGVVYQKRGDPVRARAEWRRAIAIDPMHAASRQKLAEKL